MTLEEQEVVLLEDVINSPEITVGLGAVIPEVVEVSPEFPEKPESITPRECGT